MNDAFWIFGYGSLLWRPSFAFLERVPGFVEGWGRRFWQGSTDHRGRPGAPGRVVTLVEAPRRICWGAAYHVAPPEREAVLAALDHRERGGFVRKELVVHLRARSPVRALAYVATSENPNYLGPASLEAIASQVRRSWGPSGRNKDYVLRLAKALRALDAEDEHAFALAALLTEG